MRRTRARWAILGVLGALGCGSQRPGAVAIAGPAPAPRPSPVAVAPVSARAAPAVTATVQNPEISDQDEGSPDTADAPPTAGRGWLGVELEPAGPDEVGARIARVVPKSPAEQAGLEAGDLVTRLDGEPITAPADVVGIVSQRPAGTRLGVALKRRKADRLATVTLGVFPEPGEVQRMTYVDHPAPPLEQLTVAKGSFTPSLGAQRGQVVILDFWAPWCVPCRALIPHMNELHARFAARGLRVLGITAEPVARAASAASELGIEYPVAADESGKTTIAYQARAIPSVYVIDRGGTIRDVMVGYDRSQLARLDELVQRLVTER